jgi:excisionase family DNA binding protein
MTSSSAFVLDRCQAGSYSFPVSAEFYATSVAAEKVGVTRATIQQWIKDGRIRAPKIQARAGKPPVRLWSSGDVARLRDLKTEMQMKKIRRPRNKV